MKPPFLTSPGAYTRTPRTDQSRIEYACAVEVKARPYTPAWWYAMAVITVVATVVIWVTR